jgi:8-hydroxy-5-deazaflavin:NADPH oxidoreductase
MKIGIIGSGVVAQTLGAKLVDLGEDVVLGTRDPKKLDEKRHMASTLRQWLQSVQDRAKVATFQEAAVHGDLLINATVGDKSIEALKRAEADGVGAKILIDTANELDFSKGMPPRTLASQDNCLAEKIQAAFPDLRVVKALNTIGAPVMVDPKAVGGGDHTAFIAGNDKDAKVRVTELLRSFGWSDVMDLGDVSAARGPEMYMAMWLRLWGATQTGMLNIKVVR